MEKVDIKDLPKLSTETLEEMLQRQNRILGKRLHFLLYRNISFKHYVAFLAV